MMWRWCAIGLIVLAVTVVPGCKKQSKPVSPPESSQATESTEVKITEDNLNTELDKMQKEIDADAAADTE